MTDRELLELAAKAAGFECRYTNELLGCEVHNDAMAQSAFWNPLDDDGDALRLAVKLGFVIDCSTADEPEVRYWIADSEWPLHAQAHKDYRRAIVRAAAAIGKEMP